MKVCGTCINDNLITMLQCIRFREITFQTKDYFGNKVMQVADKQIIWDGFELAIIGTHRDTALYWEWLT